MKRMPVYALALAALTFVSVPALAGTASADGTQPQTITITSAAPTGDDAIFDRVDGLGSYIPEGTSTSGLPVSFSVDSPDNACFAIPGALSRPGDPGAITIYWNAPGTCTVLADQAGDDTYAPAAQVSQTVTVGKEITALTAPKVSKGLLGLSASVFTTTLTHEFAFGPGVGSAGYADQTVTFTVLGKPVCTATTNAKGVASCRKAIGVKVATSTSTYSVSYAGDAFDNAASKSGALR
ncbi:MAG TPA: hypothetical protein VFE15_12140 [Marmoricola sp.]|jgi:hypothetical protein|nr:hypothetical protein [Marmoricola sp.]